MDKRQLEDLKELITLARDFMPSDGDTYIQDESTEAICNELADTIEELISDIEEKDRITEELTANFREMETNLEKAIARIEADQKQINTQKYYKANTKSIDLDIVADLSSAIIQKINDISKDDDISAKSALTTVAWFIGQAVGEIYHNFAEEEKLSYDWKHKGKKRDHKSDDKKWDNSNPDDPDGFSYNGRTYDSWDAMYNAKLQDETIDQLRKDAVKRVQESGIWDDPSKSYWWNGRNYPTQEAMQKAKDYDDFYRGKP